MSPPPTPSQYFFVADRTNGQQTNDLANEDNPRDRLRQVYNFAKKAANSSSFSAQADSASTAIKVRCVVLIISVSAPLHFSPAFPPAFIRLQRKRPCRKIGAFLTSTGSGSEEPWLPTKGRPPLPPLHPSLSLCKHRNLPSRATT